MVKRIKRIRPLWYLKYSKEEAINFLEKNFEWKYYGGHHLENRMTAFQHSYYNPKKFNIDQRNNSLSASVRNKKLTRKQALDIYSKPPKIEKNLVQYFKKRLGFSDDDFNRIINSEPKFYYNYPTYKNYFEILSFLFLVFVKFNLVPISFYKKYCKKDDQKN